MKNIYIAITLQNNEGKFFSYVQQTTESTNILTLIPSNTVHANIMPKERAYKAVNAHNETAKASGNYYEPETTANTKSIAFDVNSILNAYREALDSDRTFAADIFKSLLLLDSINNREMPKSMVSLLDRMTTELMERRENKQ